MTRVAKLARIAVPWALGLAILGVLLQRVDAARTLAALASGDLARYLPIAGVFIGLWLAIDASILSWLFSRLAAPIGWRRMARLRVETWPIMALSFDLANAALVASLRRTTRAPLSRVAGAMLVHYLGDLTALTGLAFGASLFVESAVLVWLRPLLGLLCAAFLGVMLAGRAGRGLLHGKPVVEVLGALSLRDVARLVAARVGFQASFAVFAWLTLPAFGVHVPALDAAARMPIVLGIAALPITPGGLGTAQAAITGLFAGFGTPSQLLAYGIVYTLTVVGLRVLLGLAVWLGVPRRERAGVAEGAA